MPFELGNTRAQDHMHGEYDDLFKTRIASNVQLSGYAWVSTTPFHIASHFNVEGSVATTALCHFNWRKCAAQGDVLFMVSPKGPWRRNGVNVPRGERLLLGIAVNDGGTLAPSTYYGLNAPTWAEGRADCIYKCKPIAETAAEKRTMRETAAELDDGTNQIVKKCTKRDGGWTVHLSGGGAVHYSLRRRSRYHNEPFPKNKRIKDFTGRVVCSRTFALFPGNAGNKKAVRLPYIYIYICLYMSDHGA
jgi:hypothetical protein